jgi:hypothetical protein
MSKTHRARLLLVSIGIGLLLVPGCGRRMVTVSGTASFPDTVKLVSTDSVQILFVPEDKAEKKVPAAALNPSDKAFSSNEILPGAKYKIAVRIDPAFGSTDGPKRAASFDGLNKAYDRASTKLAFQASDESSQSIAIDLVRGTVTKK